jgi:hypothetical protein
VRRHGACRGGEGASWLAAVPAARWRGGVRRRGAGRGADGASWLPSWRRGGEVECAGVGQIRVRRSVLAAIPAARCARQSAAARGRKWCAEAVSGGAGSGLEKEEDFARWLGFLGGS